MRIFPSTTPRSRLHEPACGSRSLLAAAFASVCAILPLSAQTYFDLSTANFSEDFSTIATWTNPTTGSWTSVAVLATGTVPSATKTTASTAAFVTGGSGGAQKGTSNLQLLSTGTSDNTTSTALDLNLNSTGRNLGDLTFNAAAVVNGTGDRKGTLRVYYSSDGSTWTELSGTGLPFIATNNVASSSAVSASLPSELDDKSTVKLRFYYHNGGGGTTGSRPKISVDDVLVTSLPTGTADTTPPTIGTLSPANNGVDVAVPSTLQIGFSEAIVAGTGSISIFKSTGEMVGTPISVPSEAVVISGSSATITPSVALTTGTSYYVQISSGAFTDNALNPFTGIADATTWTFSTVAPDTVGPIAQSYLPAADATGVQPPTSLSIIFNEPVQQPATPETTFIKLFKSVEGVPTQVTSIDTNGFSISISGATATVSLGSTVLENATTYTVEVDAGGFLDNSNNTSASISWTFTTVAIPEVTLTSPYTQDFATFNSLATLPIGWSLTGTVSTYLGTWGAGTSAGIVGNASVFGYQHTSGTGTVTQNLTLKNNSGAPITDLTISYKGRVARNDQTRVPIYTVTLDGNIVSALAYSTANGDQVDRTFTVSGLNIDAGATFQIKWSSERGASSGSSKQIGISDVEISIGAQQFAPAVTNSVPTATLNYDSATVLGEVVSDGGAAVTERGFVYSLTSLNPAPAIGGADVTTITDASSGSGTFSTAITGLSSSTSYTVSAYATNSVGTTYGTPVVFTTLVTPPSFTGTYTQLFNAYNGTNPDGWKSVSSLGAQSYAGAWGNAGGSAGFTGGVSDPGVLGYQHTNGTGTLTTTLTLINNTGAVLDTLYVSYLGRASRTTEGRSPIFTVSLNGTEVPALAYSTLNNVDANVSTTLSGLGIAEGAVFTVSWASTRGDGSGSSKQIGLADVLLSTSAPAGYEDWKGDNAGGQDGSGDFDGDGVPNGVEYFFGETGTSFTSNPQPVDGVITFPRDATATDTTYKVWKSADLVTWTDVTSATTVGAGGVSYTLPTGEGKVFVRLEVVVP